VPDYGAGPLKDTKDKESRDKGQSIDADVSDDTLLEAADNVKTQQGGTATVTDGGVSDDTLLQAPDITEEQERDTGASVDAGVSDDMLAEAEDTIQDKTRDTSESLEAGTEKSTSREASNTADEHKRDRSESIDAPNGLTAPSSTQTTYKLQSMKWGLIPFWTKRNPDYGSMIRTINCRDDSLAQNGGMWNTMKQRKRCIIVAQGFYEWLKKNNGKEKIPHFVKRKDGKLMCFAGLWDCVKYEDAEEKLYTYTIITTDSNKQLTFLHDRMPVILENGSADVQKWLDPNRSSWTKELQSLCIPYEGELDIYPVTKDVGKVGNNSPSFIIPLDSTENKNNIANFFGNQKKQAATQEAKKDIAKIEQEATVDDEVKQDPEEPRQTMNAESTEDNAPLPAPVEHEEKRGIKREHDERTNGETTEEPTSTPNKAPKLEPTSPGNFKSPPSARSSRKTRSATSNKPAQKTPPAKGDGNKRITSFFTK